MWLEIKPKKLRIILNLFIFSIALVRFATYPDTLYCLVGVAKNYQLSPRAVEGGSLYTYRCNHPNSGMPALELVHKTALDEIPLSMCAFQGKVLIGVGKLLRLYDLGKKKIASEVRKQGMFVE